MMASGLPSASSCLRLISFSSSTTVPSMSSRESPAGLAAAMCSVMSLRSVEKSALDAVSAFWHPTSSRTPTLPPMWMYDETAPLPETSKRARRDILMTSPSSANLAPRAFSTVPSSNAMDRASSSEETPLLAMVSSSVPTQAWNASFFATKSVSQLTTARIPDVAPSGTNVATMPSEVSRSARSLRLASPFSRRSLAAASRSPLASVSAFLQAIIPALVFLRSSETALAEIAMFL